MLGSQVFFYMVGLTISAVKSVAMVFSRKHHKPDVTLWIDERRLPQTKKLDYAEVHKYGTCKDNACKD
jgi:hypothetical protein